MLIFKTKKFIKIIKSIKIHMYPQVWPHSKIIEIFPNIFFVTGTNITKFNNEVIQHSRNMIIICNKDRLSLINTVRLDDIGLTELEALGKVENIIRIGAFHGRDDAFYIDRYQAKLWALEGMQNDHNKLTDIELTEAVKMPFPNSSLFIFETSKYPEAIIHIAQNDGILISCDSIKNWEMPDQFFSLETASSYKNQNLFGKATISKVWKEACNVKPSDFAKLKNLKFKHLLSSHGKPLLNDAYELISKTITLEYNI